MRKRNILIIAHEDVINGASFSLLNLMDALKEKCKFTVIVPYNNGPFLDECKKRPIKVYYVPFERWIKPKDSNFRKEKSKWFWKDNHNNQKLAKKMSKILEKESIELIHSNSSVVDFGYRLSKIMNIPHIWHIREFGIEDFNMYPLCSEKKFFKKICDKNNSLICISKAVAEKYSKKIDNNRLHIIYNGVDAKHINPKKEFPNKEDTIICLQTGMIHKAKGQNITIKAINELQKEGYKKLELWLAGSGKLEDLGIKNAEKMKWLKVLGRVNNIQELRKKVNIEIVSSQKEAFGRVTVEAMMGQIPVIGTNSGGTKELIKENENGLLYSPGNIDELKEKIEYLYNNRKEIKRLGKNAYAESKDYFQINRCAKEVFELYKEILKR